MNELKSKPSVLGGVNAVFNYVGFGIVIVITLLITVDVLARQISGTPVVWIPEVSEYGLLWVAFLSGAWGLQEEAHVTIDLVLQKLRPRASHVMSFITSLVGAAVCLVVTWFGAMVVIDFWKRKVPSIEMLGLPRALVFFIIPVGSLLMTLQFLRRAHGHWQSRRVRE